MNVMLMQLLLLLNQGATAPVARHVLIVANNIDPAGELPALRFADDDGARFAEIFLAAGSRVELLTTLDMESQPLFPGLVGRSRPPNAERLDWALKSIFGDIRRDRQEGMETEFVFVFTGHGRVRDGMGEIALADGRLTRKDLYAIIDASPADFNHVIIDACHAYFLVSSRGGWKDDRGEQADLDAIQAYLESPDELLRRPTTGVIVSTAGTAEVHEWERYRAGVFSHELRSGMLGLADVDGNRRLEYREIEAFLSAANAGVTNPRARLRIFAQPPRQDIARPLIEITSEHFSHILELPASMAGRFTVEDARGLTYAEWNKAPDHPAYLALLYSPVQQQPDYFVRRGEMEARIHLSAPAGRPDRIPFEESSLVPSEMRARGSVSESFRRELFSVPFGHAYAQGFAARRDQVARMATPRLKTEPDRIQHTISAAYLLSDALLEVDDLSHGSRIDYRWFAWEYVFLGTRFSYARTLGGKVAAEHTLDDFELGVTAGVHFRLWDRLVLMLGAQAGNRFLLYRIGRETAGEHDRDNDDLLAPWVGAEASVQVRLFGPVVATASCGVAFVFGAPDRQEETFIIPEGSLGLGVQF
ncbi:MAG: hypothetical protein JXR96_14795 [Deltaproteobacteria bacterium]|nr:hypothetical protein [Deltaproteobacteria bacterium]